MHNEPVSVRKSLVVVVLLLLVSSILLAILLASAWKTKKEKEHIIPIKNPKVMPITVSAPQDQVVSNKGDGSVVVRTSFSFEVAKGTNRGPAVVPQPK